MISTRTLVSKLPALLPQSRKKRWVAGILLAMLVVWGGQLAWQQVFAMHLRRCDARIEYRHGNVVEIFFPRKTRRFGDEEMPSLARFPRLRYLHIANTEVTEAGLVHVKKLSRLEHLLVLVDQITPERERELREAMPDLGISRLRH